MSRTPPEYLDSDCPLGSREPHDPWRSDGSGAIAWLVMGLAAIGGLIWWGLS